MCVCVCVCVYVCVCARVRVRAQVCVVEEREGGDASSTQRGKFHSLTAMTVNMAAVT